jgi:microcin C transport system substrate-binding protein
MKHSASHWSARFAALLVVAASLAGCGGGNDTAPESAAGGPVTLPKKFNVPPGADPSVSAALGGNGFEKIAADSGWQTFTLTPDQYEFYLDTAAKKGGMISIALSEFPGTLRAYGKDENSSTTRLINNLTYEPLVEINPVTLGLMPRLASHWKVDPDGQTYYFRINPNARFSDGHPVTTEDVLATYKLAVDSTILSPYTNAFYSGEFDPPQALSKYIFKVRSKTKNWKNLMYFGETAILPAHELQGINGRQYLDKYQFVQTAGTGPYVVMPNDIQKGQSLTLTRRADWWGYEDPANKWMYNFDKIRINVVTDERLTLEKFKKGENDVYPVARAQWWLNEFNDDPIQRGIMQKTRIYNDAPISTQGFIFNMRKPPFDDPRVREAFILLFNREGLVQKLMFNQYTLTDSYFPNSPAENPNNPKYRYNPQRAAQLLAEAGYTSRNSDGILVKNGHPFVVELPVEQDLDRIITPVQQDLKNAGIQLNIRTVDGVTKFKMLNERNFNVSYMSWGGIPFPNPKSSYYSNLADVPNTNNLAGFKDKRADELMDAEQLEFDPVKRAAILQELDLILMNSKQYAWAWHAPYQRLVYWNYLRHPKWGLGKIYRWDENLFTTWWYDADAKATVMKGRADKSIKMPVEPVDNNFWPTYDKAHPIVGTPTASGNAAPGATKSDSGSAKK